MFIEQSLKDIYVYMYVCMYMCIFVYIFACDWKTSVDWEPPHDGRFIYFFHQFHRLYPPCQRIVGCCFRCCGPWTWTLSKRVWRNGSVPHISLYLMGKMVSVNVFVCFFLFKKWSRHSYLCLYQVVGSLHLQVGLAGRPFESTTSSLTSSTLPEAVREQERTSNNVTFATRNDGTSTASVWGASHDDASPSSSTVNATGAHGGRGATEAMITQQRLPLPPGNARCTFHVFKISIASFIQVIWWWCSYIYLFILIWLYSIPAILTKCYEKGWEERHSRDGRVFYIDHNTRTTQWHRPEFDIADITDLPPVYIYPFCISIFLWEMPCFTVFIMLVFLWIHSLTRIFCVHGLFVRTGRRGRQLKDACITLIITPKRRRGSAQQHRLSRTRHASMHNRPKCLAYVHNMASALWKWLPLSRRVRHPYPQACMGCYGSEVLVYMMKIG